MANRIADVLGQMDFSNLGGDAGQEKTYKTPGSAGGQIMSAIETGLSSYSEAKQKKRDLEIQKQKYFFSLRDNGYSPDQAGRMVEKIYGTFETPPATAGLSDKQIERMTAMETLKEKQAKAARGYDVKETETIAEKSTREMKEFEDKEEIKAGLKKTKKKYLFKLPPEDRFKIKKGWFGIKKKVEAFDEKTFAILEDIKTEGDLEELIERRKDFEAQGIDVRKIIDYFMTEEEEE